MASSFVHCDTTQIDSERPKNYFISNIMPKTTTLSMFLSGILPKKAVGCLLCIEFKKAVMQLTSTGKLYISCSAHVTLTCSLPSDNVVETMLRHVVASVLCHQIEQSSLGEAPHCVLAWIASAHFRSLAVLSSFQPTCWREPGGEQRPSGIPACP